MGLCRIAERAVLCSLAVLLIKKLKKKPGNLNEGIHIFEVFTYSQ